MSIRNTPAWSPLTDHHVITINTMVRLAEAGNVDAGRRLMSTAAQFHRTHQPLPASLADWCAAKLEAVVEDPARAGQALRVAPRRGRPPDHAGDMHAAVAFDAVKNQAAWAAYHSIRCGEGTYKGGKNIAQKCAFDIIAAWLTETQNLFYEPDTIRHWYDERLKYMTAEQQKLDDILKTLPK